MKVRLQVLILELWQNIPDLVKGPIFSILYVNEFNKAMSMSMISPNRPFRNKKTHLIT